MKKKWLVFLAAISIVLLLGISDIYIFNEDTIQTYEFSGSKEEIRAKWNKYRPKYKGKTFHEDPSPTSPYKIGKLENGFIQDGVNMANFVRYLAGLPDDLLTNSTYNNQAQYGAVLLAATKELSHNPSKPDDMSRNFYNVGHRATRNSNIAKGIYKLSDAVAAYMMDFGDSNLEDVGHRRWILNPQMKTIGFGYYNGYSTMKVKNTDRTRKFNYDYIAYPSEGYFPCNIFYADDFPYGSNPWSIILNPEKYDNEKTSDIRVEFEDLSNSIVWELCPKYRESDCGRYFNVDTSNCGVPFCIIFRPDSIDDYT